MHTDPSAPLRVDGDENVTSPNGTPDSSSVAIAELFNSVSNPRSSVETRNNPSPARVVGCPGGDREISSSPAPSPSQCRYSPTSSRGTPVRPLPSGGYDTRDLTKQLEEDEQAWKVKDAGTDVQALQREIERLKSKLHAGQEVRADLKVELEASKLKEDAAQRHLEMLEEEINLLRVELQAIKEDASRHQQEYQQLLQWCSTCETERDQAVRRLEAVLQTLKSEQQASLNRQLSLDAASMTSQELRGQLVNLQQELRLCNEQVRNADKAQRELSESRNTANELGDELQAVRSELAETKRKFEEVDIERSVLEREIERERRRMTLKEKAYVSTQLELRESKEKIKSIANEAQSNADRMQKASLGAKEAFDRLSGELHKCRTDLTHALQRAMLAEEKVRLLENGKENVGVVGTEDVSDTSTISEAERAGKAVTQSGTSRLPQEADDEPHSNTDEVVLKKQQIRAVRSAKPLTTGSRSAATCGDTNLNDSALKWQTNDAQETTQTIWKSQLSESHDKSAPPAPTVKRIPLAIVSSPTCSPSPIANDGGDLPEDKEKLMTQQQTNAAYSTAPPSSKSSPPLSVPAADQVMSEAQGARLLARIHASA